MVSAPSDCQQQNFQPEPRMGRLLILQIIVRFDYKILQIIIRSSFIKHSVY